MSNDVTQPVLCIKCLRYGKSIWLMLYVNRNEVIQFVCQIRFLPSLCVAMFLFLSHLPLAFNTPNFDWTNIYGRPGRDENGAGRGNRSDDREEYIGFFSTRGLKNIERWKRERWQEGSLNHQKHFPPFLPFSLLPVHFLRVKTSKNDLVLCLH